MCQYESMRHDIIDIFCVGFMGKSILTILCYIWLQKRNDNELSQQSFSVNNLVLFIEDIDKTIILVLIWWDWQFD